MQDVRRSYFVRLATMGLDSNSNGFFQQVHKVQSLPSFTPQVNAAGVVCNLAQSKLKYALLDKNRMP